jgi:hypothetical protein
VVALQRFRLGLTSAVVALLLVAGANASAQQVDCQGGFTAAKAEYEKRGHAVEAANKRKANAEEACGLFKSLVEAQGKMFKFLKDNKTACGVPDEVIKNISTSLTKTTEVKTRVCQVAATGGGKPAPSAGLSGAINITGDVGGTPPENSGGLFDTLNGNILQR